MALDRQDVEKIAHLARLQIEDVDVPDYARNLSDIIEFVEQLKAASTDNVEPMAHPLKEVQRLRQDVVTEENNRDEFQIIAPLTEDGLYLVPRVIE